MENNDRLSNNLNSKIVFKVGWNTLMPSLFTLDLKLQKGMHLLHNLLFSRRETYLYLHAQIKNKTMGGLSTQIKNISIPHANF